MVCAVKVFWRVGEMSVNKLSSKLIVAIITMILVAIFMKITVAIIAKTRN